MLKKNDIKKKGSQTLAKAIEILNYISEQTHPVTITECSENLELNKTTTYRLFYTLEKYDYIYKDNKKSYRLGSQMLRLNKAYKVQFGTSEYMNKQLNTLLEQTNETVNLLILEDDMCVYVRTIEGTQKVRRVPSIGSHDYPHCTAAGKSILAFVPFEEAAKILRSNGMPKLTNNTITNIDEFKETLRTVKKRGWAYDNEENELGCKCIAAPIFDSALNPIAAVSISGPPSRFNDNNIKTWSNLIKNTAIELSTSIFHVNKDKILNLFI